MRLVPVLLLSASCAAARAGEPWIAELSGDDPGVGRQRVLLVLEVEDDGARVELAGGSRRRALSAITGRTLVGLYELVTARHGALVELAGAGGGTALDPLRVRCDAPTGAIELEGVRHGAGFAGRWRGPGLGARSGAFRLMPYPAPADAPLEDYPALLDAFAVALEDDFAFPARLAEPEWRRELESARARAADVVDDFEFVALVARLCEPLAPSTLCLRGAHKPDDADVELAWAGDVAVIRCGVVRNGTDEIDAAFAAARGARALVLDLRGSVGYDLSPGRLFAYLAPRAEPCGYMLGRGRADGGPLSDEARAKVTVLTGVTGYSLYRKGLAMAGAVGAGVAPLEEGAFAGPVVVLIDGYTRAGLEPVAEYLQRSGRATLYGEPTAGASVDADLIPLKIGGQKTGWTAIVPAATWVTWEGRWMERDPVRPDVAVASADALTAALERLAPKPAESL
jgi:hypothetical protein